MKHLTLTLKSSDLQDTGQFEGYASTFGNVDQGGDLIEPGAFRESVAKVRDEFASAFGDAMSMMDAFSARWRENSIAAAKARLAAKADEIRGDSTDRASSAKGPKETQAERALQAARDFAANLALETAKIGKTPIEIKRMEVAMAALKAPTDEARIAILEAGEAWEQATRAFATSEFLRQTVGPLEQQVALLGQSARAQALANLEAEREQSRAGIG